MAELCDDPNCGKPHHYHYERMRCELVRDELGWWMQYIGDDGRYHCTLMEAQNEKEAQLEAMEEGFSQIAIIPKPPVP